MKKKFVVILIIFALVAGAWLVAFNSLKVKDERMQEIIAKIEANDKVKTYKNSIGLYEELISLDRKNIKWYVKCANNYKLIERYANYENTCKLIMDKFPSEQTGYEMLLNYYLTDLRHEKVVTAYLSMPEEIKKMEAIESIYKKSEWMYTVESGGYDMIDMFRSGYAVVSKQGLYGYVDQDASEQILCKFVTARPFIGKYAAVFSEGEWFFIDKVGDRVIASQEKIEDLYSFSEGYAVACIGGKYGYVDESFNKYSFDYEKASNFCNGVAAVQKGGKWALINAKFETITDFTYDNIILDSANVCSVQNVIFAQQNGVYLMLNTSGEKITADTYEDAKSFYSDRAAVKNSGKWGFVNTKGEVIIEYKYEDAKAFNLGIAPVKVNGKWGLINEKNEVIVECLFEDAQPSASTGMVALKDTYYKFIQFYKYK